METEEGRDEKRIKITLYGKNVRLNIRSSRFFISKSSFYIYLSCSTDDTV